MTDVTEQMIISTFTRVCGAFSMLGCGYIMYEVLTSKKKRQGTYFRLMFVMSFFEFCDGLACFLGSWAVPSEPIPWWGTSGTHGSCKFQAFLIQAAVGSSLYNAVLAIYYLLCIRYNWSERFIKQKVEPWMHGICLILAYGTAIASLFLGIYGSVGLLCMTTRYPPDCKETYKYGYTDCIYGDNASLYDILLFEIWLWMSILISAAAMCFVWSAVRNQESRNASYITQAFQNNSNSTVNNNNNSSSNNNNSSGRPTTARSVVNRKYSRRFAVQGALYVAVFYLCHLFASSAMTLYHATGEWNELLLTLAAIFEPLEGFLNFLVYMRPRWIRKWSKRKQQRKNNNNNDSNANSSVSNVNSSTVSSERTHFLKSIINFFGRGGRGASLADDRPEANPPTPSNAITAENNDVDNPSDTFSSNDQTVQLDEREQMDLDALPTNVIKLLNLLFSLLDPAFGYILFNCCQLNPQRWQIILEGNQAENRVFPYA